MQHEKTQNASSALLPSLPVFVSVLLAASNQVSAQGTDDDQDGIPDTVEMAAPYVVVSEPALVPENGRSAAQVITLPVGQAGVGASAEVRSVQVQGDLADVVGPNADEYLVLDLNHEEFVSPRLVGLTECSTRLEPASPTVSATVTVVDIGNGAPGIRVEATSGLAVDEFCEADGALAARYQLTIAGAGLGDTDLDGIPNAQDLDSDNDTIPDVVEVGLTDADADGRVDESGDLGTITAPLDSDGDGLADYIDLESGNAANDGTAYDILTGPYADQDTNGDGVLDSHDAAGGSDANANGLDDLAEDADADGLPNITDPDDDNDGVSDDDDAFPLDPTETLDTDNDGVGDNQDAFPNDSGETQDSDADGVGDNQDPDADNDGMADALEAVSEYVFVTPQFDLPRRGGSATQVVDLSVQQDGLFLADTVQVVLIEALGYLKLNPDYDPQYYSFMLDFNAGELVTPDMETTHESSCPETDDLAPVSPAVAGPLKVIDIGGGVPGVVIEGTTGEEVENACGTSGTVATRYQVTLVGSRLGDSDGDGVLNPLDLDSDNDTIADIVEAGLVDANGDAVIDDPADQGIVAVLPDTDSDGIPDYLDLESTNAANDGTAYDILANGFASIDSNGDGMINDEDDGGGVDANANGLDDLAEDRDGDGIPDNVDLDDDNDGVEDTADAFSKDPAETTDSDGDGVGDNADAFPNDPTETADSDSDGVGDNSDDDMDNDGIPDAIESVYEVDYEIVAGPLRMLGWNTNVTEQIDLSAQGAQVGDLVQVSSLRAKGDFDDAPYEYFMLDFNTGELVSPRLMSDDCCDDFVPVEPLLEGTVSVIDLGGGTPGLEIRSTTGIEVTFSEPAYTLTVAGTRAADGDDDGVANLYDLDSDNDSIADVIEAGLGDTDGNAQVDDPAAQGTVTAPPDSDSDGLADYLDLESTNPANDGTAYDIEQGPYASADTNRDGRLDSNDVSAGADINNNGLDDIVEDADADGVPNADDPDDDNDGVDDSQDPLPFDPNETMDTDNDGVGDNSDAFPLDPGESADSDGDGVGDNADAFPLDPTETADSDGDGVGDNADLFPSDPTESADGDGDGLGDNRDIDADNDGIADDAETFDAPFEVLTPTSDLPTDGGSATQLVRWCEDLDTIGDLVQVSSVLAASRISDFDPPSFVLNINSGELLSRSLNSYAQNCDVLQPVQIPFEGTVRVIDLDDGVPGISIQGTTELNGPGYPRVCDDDSSIAVRYSLTVSGECPGDTDGDGVLDQYDLDSDGDAIADILEAGLQDLDGDARVDQQSEQGFVTNPPDSDNDGIADYQDLESTNPANDGTAYDIAASGFAAFDTNQDGRIDGEDVGGGVDANGNGLDDLVEDTDGDGIPNYADPDDDNDGVPDQDDAFPHDPNESADSDGDGVGDNADAFPNDPNETVDSDGDGVGDNADVFPNDPNESADSDGDGVGDNADAFPNDPSETQDSDGDGVGDNADIDADNDGLPDNFEKNAAVEIIDWLIADDEGFTVEGNTVVYDGTGGGWDRQINSVPVSFYGFTDGFRVSWRLQSSVADNRMMIGLGTTESSVDFSDIDFAFFNALGLVSIYENGIPMSTSVLITDGAELAITVENGLLTYFVDGNVIRTTTFCCLFNFYIDSSFDQGPVTLADFIVESVADIPDTDGDGVADFADLDADNDTIADVLEAGLPDANGDFLIDQPGDQGSVSMPLNTDGDHLSDYVDLESGNPNNDGTDYDIQTGPFAALDTDGDGRLTSNDVGGGIDADGDGIDDLIDGDPTRPGSLALVDSDQDGRLDADDNCLFTVNADQTDSDGDGIGNPCDADLNNDCEVNFVDLSLLRSRFFTVDPDADLNVDGSVNFIDLDLMRGALFSRPGPSGIPNDCSHP